ncbi:hypothetical protein SAMN05443574_106102 [Haloarcula vallismortis]|uniref:Uncharacterized protein n=2 Tax=Haloarcula vallismortis TaxID=28442 RepID=M0JI74_HALVA|nr:hypothetical protein [Haloarcula vallismortis]EMA07699.1 hypothetical protein C437_09663 [Haloarcula vallismortis ATCC 29715]SDW73559.1 hypothetical protein SAMN05443574_106102 [Haloarcula vallismortis]
MTGVEFPLSGSTLVTGPSNAGKTRTTAAAIDAWLDREGTAGVVVLDFAPELERDGTVLGGRLDRFITVPETVWAGRIDASAPRAESGTDEQAVALAQENARLAQREMDRLPPNPRAVFVNDATIPFQYDSVAVCRLTEYCDGADVAVLNAFDSDELGLDNPVSRTERDAVDRLRAWADRTVDLS